MTMTIEQLKGMKVAELRTVAVSEGVVYWNKEAKRKMNKSEIIVALTAHFTATTAPEAAEIQVVPATVEVVQAETAPDFATMKPHEVVKFVKDQAAKLDVQALKALVVQILEANHHKLTDRRNKLLVRTWSNIRTQLTSIIKIASKRKLAQ